MLHGLVRPSGSGRARHSSMMRRILVRLTLGTRGAQLRCRWSRVTRDWITAEHFRVPDDSMRVSRRRTNRIRMHEWNVELFSKRLCDGRGLRKQLRERLVESGNQRSLGAEVGSETQRLQRNITKPAFGDGAKKTLNACLPKEIDRLFGVADEKDRLGVPIQERVSRSSSVYCEDEVSCISSTSK